MLMIFKARVRWFTRLVAISAVAGWLTNPALGRTDEKPFETTAALKHDRQLQFADLERQLGQRAEIRKRSGQMHREDALIFETDRDPADVVIRRVTALLEDLRTKLSPDEVSKFAAQIAQLQSLNTTTAIQEKSSRYGLFERACDVRRKLTFANPLLGFDKVLFAKRAPGTFSHMSDQYYGWWSRGGGGIYVIENFKTDSPRLICLTSQMDSGSFLRPELSFDGSKILFAYCKFYPEVAKTRNKVDKQQLPEDSFYHVYEMNVDGSGVRQLTRGHYDDFDAHYLPNGEIAFLSTRRGQFVQSSKHCATKTQSADALPDSYVRCGGDNYRPVAVYTLHAMNVNGGNLRAISPFENFEWTPAVANDGRIFYSRWDYVDRDAMPYVSLWSTSPDGTNPQLVYGNYTINPYSVLGARPIPNSPKLIFTASAHHSITAGGLVLLDPTEGKEGTAPLRRLTPEVCSPEIEGWPETWYTDPWPLSEDFYLTSWSHRQLARQGHANPPNGAGVYVFDTFGNRELVYYDEAISSLDPTPLVPRIKPPQLATTVDWDARQEGRFLLLNVYDGLQDVPLGEIKKLRVVAVPAKTQPKKNDPRIGVTSDDPGKCVLGTVPVEADGSAHFRVPASVNVFFQALNAEGVAVQTMRTVSYVQPNQTLSCVGCHESRDSSPHNAHPLAALREASKLTPGPEGSWPLRFDKLVQPVLDRHCVQCHNSKDPNPIAAQFDLTPAGAYEKLVSFGKVSLQDHVQQRRKEGASIAGQGAAQTSALLSYLKTDLRHRQIQFSRDDSDRLLTWIDTYGQRFGSFSEEQERELELLRNSIASLLDKKQ